jgi:hypothetical protein
MRNYKSTKNLTTMAKAGRNLKVEKGREKVMETHDIPKLLRLIRLNG